MALMDTTMQSPLLSYFGVVNTYPKKGSDSSKLPPPQDRTFTLNPLQEGERLTIFLKILDFLRPHLIMLSQLYYPLMQYVHVSYLRQMVAAWKPESAKWLPDDFNYVPRGNLNYLDNRQFIYILQLLVRPTSPDIRI